MSGDYWVVTEKQSRSVMSCLVPAGLILLLTWFPLVIGALLSPFAHFGKMTVLGTSGACFSRSWALGSWSLTVESTVLAPDPIVFVLFEGSFLFVSLPFGILESVPLNHDFSA